VPKVSLILSLELALLRSGLLHTRSDFDIKRTLVVSLTWQVPSPKSLSGPAAWIAKGWELGGIYKVSDGVPFTATWGRVAIRRACLTSDDWAFPDRLSTPGCSSSPIPGTPTTMSRLNVFRFPRRPTPRFGRLNCDRCRPSLGVPIGDPSAPLYRPLACFNLRRQCGPQSLDWTGGRRIWISPVLKINRIKRFRRTSTYSSGRNSLTILITRTSPYRPHPTARTS